MSLHSPSAPAMERRRRYAVSAFTLVEIMVSTVLLLIMMGMTASMVSSTQQVWSRTSSQTDQLRNARHAFDIVSRRIAQATLNPYWTVIYDGNTPTRYERASELRFHSGMASSLVSEAAPGGSAIFFQSPTGYYADGSGDLGCALNTWGYFVEYGSDATYRPPFLNGTKIPERYRYRLVEFLDPSDKLTIFKYSSGDPEYKDNRWFTDHLNTTDSTDVQYKRILADNIVAFVVMPKLSTLDTKTVSALAPELEYNSTDRKNDPKVNPRHQLPPLVDIAAVVIDEQSAAKIRWGATPPDFNIQRDKLFLKADNLNDDLETLRTALLKKGINAEIFRMTVPIVAARWSTEQKN